MTKLRLGFAVFYLVALLLSMTAFQAAAQDANFVGSWDMTVTGDAAAAAAGVVVKVVARATVRVEAKGMVRVYGGHHGRWRAAIANHHQRRRQI